MITSERILKVLRSSPSLDIYSNREKEELSFHIGDIINEMDLFIKMFKINDKLNEDDLDEIYQMIVIHWPYHMKEIIFFKINIKYRMQSLKR